MKRKPQIIIGIALIMLDEARSSIYINPSLILYPGICLIVCCAGFNLLGEGLRDRIGKEDEISAT